jgi:hypothetical protein
MAAILPTSFHHQRQALLLAAAGVPLVRPERAGLLIRSVPHKAGGQFLTEQNRVQRVFKGHKTRELLLSYPRNSLSLRFINKATHDQTDTR